MKRRRFSLLRVFKLKSKKKKCNAEVSGSKLKKSGKSISVKI